MNDGRQRSPLWIGLIAVLLWTFSIWVPTRVLALVLILFLVTARPFFAFRFDRDQTGQTKIKSSFRDWVAIGLVLAVFSAMWSGLDPDRLANIVGGLFDLKFHPITDALASLPAVSSAASRLLVIGTILLTIGVVVVAYHASLGALRFWVENLFTVEKLSGYLAIALFLFSPYYFSQDRLLLVYQAYLCAINCALLAYVFFILKRRLYRYAVVPEHLHFVNHNVRDWLYELNKGARDKTLRTEDFEKRFKDNTEKILDQVAAAFTHLTGVRCAACVKELKTNRLLHVVARDSMSSQRRSGKAAPKPHDIDDDTPCWSVYAKENPDRYYGHNNVIAAWQRKNFKSASFKAQPKVLRVFGYCWPISWPLGFRSCLVVPIRYANCITPPQSVADGEWNYWGFLCVDSRHRNVFDFERMWLLSAAFADVLFVYYSRTFDIMDEVTRP